MSSNQCGSRRDVSMTLESVALRSQVISVSVASRNETTTSCEIFFESRLRWRQRCMVSFCVTVLTARYSTTDTNHSCIMQQETGSAKRTNVL